MSNEIFEYLSEEEVQELFEVGYLTTEDLGKINIGLKTDRGIRLSPNLFELINSRLSEREKVMFVC